MAGERLGGLLAEALDRGTDRDRRVGGRAAPAAAPGQGRPGPGRSLPDLGQGMRARPGVRRVRAGGRAALRPPDDRRGLDQFERSSDAFEQLSDLRTILAAELPDALPTPSGTPVDFSQDVLPWAERDLALTLLPGPGESSLPVFIAGVEDQAGAEAFLTKVAPAGEVKTAQVGRRGDERLRRRLRGRPRRRLPRLRRGARGAGQHQRRLGRRPRARGQRRGDLDPRRSCPRRASPSA